MRDEHEQINDTPLNILPVSIYQIPYHMLSQYPIDSCFRLLRLGKTSGAPPSPPPGDFGSSIRVFHAQLWVIPESKEISKSILS